MQVNTHAIGYHDVILAYAQVVNETLAEGGNIFNGLAMARKMKNRTFTGGVRGRLMLDANGDSDGNFEIWSFQYSTSSFEVNLFLSNL